MFFLLDFLKDNKSIEILDLHYMKFTEEVTAKIFTNNWFKHYSFDVVKNPVETLIKNFKVLEDQNIFTNEIIIFFNNKEFAPIYVTKNIESILGYTQQQFLDWGKDALLNIGAFENRAFWKDLTKWQSDFLEIELTPMQSPFVFRAFLGGYCYNHKDGRTKKFLFRTEHPIRENNAFPDYHFARLEDIEHLIKKDGYWLYYEKSNGLQKVSKFYSKQGVFKYPITKREKEILEMITSGMETKEIAEKLFISLDTVLKHRKNMVKRLNAKNIESVIQLCKLCEII